MDIKDKEDGGKGTWMAIKKLTGNFNKHILVQ